MIHPEGRWRMTRRSGPEAAEAVKKDWSRWTCLVAVMARGRSARAAIGAEEYRELYRRLTTNCRELAGSADNPGRTLHETMIDTVRPWLSPQALERADREILGVLLQRCRWIERAIGVRTGVLTHLRRAAPLFLLPAATVIVVVGWTLAVPRIPLVDAVRFRWAMVWMSVKRTSDVEKLCLVGIVLILISIYSVSRMARS
jgi:hypothetical protein